MKTVDDVIRDYEWMRCQYPSGEAINDDIGLLIQEVNRLRKVVEKVSARGIIL